ncbi:MAG TPA: crossover junction endodeoxyribonuclease RuvC [Candidatus Woesebacteria bacterium]|nr:crossover junction endodeoxyribonuclease RuvC [Candidatus Woesebacteria bacterium]
MLPPQKTMRNNPIIIGIDPGYDRVGVAIGQKTDQTWRLFTYHCIQTEQKAQLFERYAQIARELDKLVRDYQVTQASIESLFWFKNQSTALNVSEARGVIIATLLRTQVKIAEYTPLQVKQSLTGYGRADKKAVEKMVRMELHLEDKMIDDTIDALAIMICHECSRKLKENL